MFFTLLSFFALLSTTSGSIKDCGNGLSRLQLTELALKPDPPVPGTDLYMTVRFDNPGDAVTDGTVTTAVTLNFVPFTPSTEALCTNTKCPLVSGLNDRSTVGTTPTSVQGKVVTKIVWTAVDGSELLCITTSFSLGSLADNTTKSLRGSTSSTNALNQTHASLIASLFRRKQGIVSKLRRGKNTSLAIYRSAKKHQHPTRYFMDPLPIVYNGSIDVCYIYEGPSKVSTVNYALVKWRPKTNALRFSSF